MDNNKIYFVIGVIIVMFSVPLGRLSMNLFYGNTNLVGEVEPF